MGHSGGENVRAVTIALGKDDIQADSQRLAGLYRGDQLRHQVARPGPLAVLVQAVAIDTDDNDRFVESRSRHLALVAVKLGIAQTGEGCLVDLNQCQAGQRQENQGQGSATTGPDQGKNDPGGLAHKSMVRPS